MCLGPCFIYLFGLHIIYLLFEFVKCMYFVDKNTIPLQSIKSNKLSSFRLKSFNCIFTPPLYVTSRSLSTPDYFQPFSVHVRYTHKHTKQFIFTLFFSTCITHIFDVLFGAPPDTSDAPLYNVSLCFRVFPFGLFCLAS